MFEIIPNWHPLLVHFTVALLSVAVVLHLLVLLALPQRLQGEWRIVARWSLWIGRRVCPCHRLQRVVGL